SHPTPATPTPLRRGGAEMGLPALRYMCDEGGAYVVFDRSPFYAESGGQVGDRGWVTLADGTQLAVVDTKTSVGLHWHRVEGAVRHFSPQQLASVSLQVDEVCRAQIRRNHSATHLLHSALRHILGAHVEQQGSHVDHERIRFDFTSPQGLTGEQERAVEDLVNQWIWQNHPIETRLMSLAEAKQSGAMALFGEKYGDTVRVLQMGEVSRELCGGTHAMATGEIGLLRIVSESSVAAGVRRVEAITGQRAVTADRERAHVLREVAQKLKTKPEHVLTRVDKMSAELKDLNQQVKQAKAHQRQNYLNTLISKAESHVSGAPMLVTELDAELMDAADLQSFLDQCADKMSHGIAFLTHTQGDNVSVLACVGKQYRDILPAGGFVKHVCATAGGRGGGRADKARGGVKGAEHAQAMLREAKKWMDAKLV
ncbi:MAG: DHHA1 domain-containing protein, partial [Zetaproteobacteria bacterium]|nr:DHHA1 domain-containing protein [Zetaproteobacteria bacterium]